MSDRVQGVVSQQGNDLSDLVNRYAEAEQCDAVGLVAGLISESNLDEQAARWGPWPDVSFGLGQQTVAYAPVGDHTASAANIALVRDYYFQPENAIRDAAAQYGAYYRAYGDFREAWSRYNGGPSMAYADNPNRANLDRGWREAQAYRAAAAAAPTYNPDQPDERQVQDWTCSVRTATWLLKSIGGTLDAGTVQARMVAAGLVSPQDGLEDGSGAGLAAFLAGASGLPTGHAWVSWADLQAMPVGVQPFGLGGVYWNHWVAVRRWAADGVLEIMNPAPGYKGVYDRLAPETFALLGPFAAVWIELPPGGDDMDCTDLINRLGYLQGDVADAIEGAINAAKTARTKADRDAKLQAALAAVHTLRTEGTA